MGRPELIFIPRLRSRRGTSLTELAIFGGIALGALGFLIRTFASELGTVRASQRAFRLCLRHAGADNLGAPYEARAVSGYLQIATPNVTLGSWDMSAGDAKRGCFVEWGPHLTMSTAPAECTPGPGEARVFGYSGNNGTWFFHSKACGPPGSNLPLDSERLITTRSGATTTQSTVLPRITTGTAISSGRSTLSTTLISGATVSHTVAYGGDVTGGTTAP